MLRMQPSNVVPVLCLLPCNIATRKQERQCNRETALQRIRMGEGLFGFAPITTTFYDSLGNPGSCETETGRR
jgi:hypothetical protein